MQKPKYVYELKMPWACKAHEQAFYESNYLKNGVSIDFPGNRFTKP